jgi:thiamine-phosphate pyrophosphorylase
VKELLKGLYIVTPDWDDTDKLLRSTQQTLQGGANIVQYRHKNATPELRREQAAALLKLCRQFNKPFIINDHLDLCLELDADGLHVGGTDAPVAQVRDELGADKIVGASCYGDLALAQRAWREGASYVAYGGFFPSRVKKYPVTTSHSIIAQSKAELPLPVCVIGGMTVENSTPLRRQGADMVAVISAVYFTEDVLAATRMFVSGEGAGA